VNKLVAVKQRYLFLLVSSRAGLTIQSNFRTRRNQHRAMYRETTVRHHDGCDFKIAKMEGAINATAQASLIRRSARLWEQNWRTSTRFNFFSYI